MGHQDGYLYPKPERRPKKRPKPLKRTALKRQSKAAKEKAERVLQAKIEKAELTPLVCQACGNTKGFLTPSHVLPQGEYPHLAGVVANIRWHCQYPCHDDCETLQFWKMRDGLYCLEYIFQNEREPKRKFWRAITKYEQNYYLWQHSHFYDPEIHVL